MEECDKQSAIPFVIIQAIWSGDTGVLLPIGGLSGLNTSEHLGAADGQSG
jgi:hypothetical protein